MILLRTVAQCHRVYKVDMRRYAFQSITMGRARDDRIGRLKCKLEDFDPLE